MHTSGMVLRVKRYFTVRTQSWTLSVVKDLEGVPYKVLLIDNTFSKHSSLMLLCSYHKWRPGAEVWGDGKNFADQDF